MIWEVSHSVEFINKKRSENSVVRGYQGQMAKAAGTHGSYLSRVLGREVQLTPDQAAGLCEFWGLNTDEGEYFLTLVNLERAGTLRLQTLLRRRLDELKAKHQRLSEKLDVKSAPPTGTPDLVIYYSNWHYMAIHVALTIPDLRTPASLAKHLKLPLAFVGSTLATLEGLGLARRNSENRWTPIDRDLHRDCSETFASTQQASWRVQTAARMHAQRERALHYTAVHSVSRRDFEMIRAKFVEQIVITRRAMMASAEEELVCFCLDWYPLD